MAGSAPKIGIFAKTFPRGTLEETLCAVSSHGFRVIQFNLSCAGLPTLPNALPVDQVDRIGSAVTDRGLAIAALSGTFNAIDPDRAGREDDIRRFAVLSGSCRRLGASVVTLCTGTRDTDDMWRRHPENETAGAWQEMVGTLRRLIEIADRDDLVLAFEPETGNVVDTSTKARRLLDEIGSPRLKVVLDPANLFDPDNLGRMDRVLDEAFDLLSSDVALVHAKDVLPDGSGTTSAGLGVLDYPRFAALYHRHSLDVPIVLHGLAEADVATCREFVARTFSIPTSRGIA